MTADEAKQTNREAAYLALNVSGPGRSELFAPADSEKGRQHETI
jgi:hypothetical protein